MVVLVGGGGGREKGDVRRQEEVGSQVRVTCDSGKGLVVILCSFIKCEDLTELLDWVNRPPPVWTILA